MSALLFWLSAALATFCTLLAASWFVIELTATKARWVSDGAPCSTTALWLGCPVHTKAFQARVEGLQELLGSSTLQRLVISGTKEEVEACISLLRVPENVTLRADTEGYRTYASLVSLGREETAVTVISHRFHLKRVAFLANGLNLSTTLYPVGEELGPWTSRGRWREAFARLRAVIDRLFPYSEHEQQRKHQ